MKKKQLIKLFSTLADETRLDIVLALSKQPLAVNQIHDAVPNITLSAVSHQLRLMADMDIVKYKKTGREKKYSLSDSFCWCILKNAIAHKEGKCEACK
jgi:ArsR family transcriptional regulator